MSHVLKVVKKKSRFFLHPPLLWIWSRSNVLLYQSYKINAMTKFMDSFYEMNHFCTLKTFDLFAEFCTKLSFLEETEINLSEFTYNGKCVKMFSTGHEETGNFKKDWTLITNDSYEAKTRTELAFIHQENLDGLPVVGLHGIYPTRGYVATLGKYMSKITDVLKSLKENNWIDRFTKALIIDTVTYNANTNLFTRIRIVIEKPSIGNTVIQANIHSFVLYTYVGSAGMVTLMLQVAWLIVMIYMTVRMVRGIIKQRSSYFTSNYWNILRLIGLTFAVLAAVTFVVKVVFTMKLVERVKNELGKLLLISYESTQFFFMQSLLIFA